MLRNYFEKGKKLGMILLKMVKFLSLVFTQIFSFNLDVKIVYMNKLVVIN